MRLSCPNAVESQNGMNDWRRLEHESKMLDKGKGVPHIAKPEESFASGVDIRLGSIQSDGLTPGIGTPLLKDDHRCRWSKRLVWYTALMALAAGLSGPSAMGAVPFLREPVEPDSPTSDCGTVRGKRDRNRSLSEADSTIGWTMNDSGTMAE